MFVPIAPTQSFGRFLTLFFPAWTLVPCSLFVNYEIEFKSSAEVASADALSRLPLQYRKDASVEEEIFHVAPQPLKRHPVSAAEIAKDTSRNPLSAKALTQNGWPINHCADPELKPYFTRRHEWTLRGARLPYVGPANCHTSFFKTNHPDRITWRPSWNCTHEINSPQSCLVAENRSGDWKGYPWMSTVQQNPQGASSLTASSMVLADNSMETCSRRFCHPSGKTIPHHGRRPL